MAALREPPENEFSFIYETGQNEMDAKGIPETSAWAEKLGCGARVRKADVVDAKPGYVYDSTGRTLVRMDGDGCRVRVRRKFSSIRIAGAGELWRT